MRRKQRIFRVIYIWNIYEPFLRVKWLWLTATKLAELALLLFCWVVSFTFDVKIHSNCASAAVCHLWNVKKNCCCTTTSLKFTWFMIKVGCRELLCDEGGVRGRNDATDTKLSLLPTTTIIVRVGGWQAIWQVIQQHDMKWEWEIASHKSWRWRRRHDFNLCKINANSPSGHYSSSATTQQLHFSHKSHSPYSSS